MKHVKDQKIKYMNKVEKQLYEKSQKSSYIKQQMKKYTRKALNEIYVKTA